LDAKPVALGQHRYLALIHYGDETWQGYRRCPEEREYRNG
jgi:hypothetical protein